MLEHVSRHAGAPENADRERRRRGRVSGLL
jgi:hypothetical protein